MKVQVTLGNGDVQVGEITVDVDDPVEVEADQDVGDEDSSLRAAAVAWHAFTYNGVFTVNSKRYSASECAEWWA